MRSVQDRVANMMSAPTATIDLGSSMRQAAEIMAANDIGMIMVFSRGEVIGLVTERDIVNHVANGANPEHLTIEEIVTTAPITVSPKDSVRDAANMMIEAQVRHLPVMDGGELVGVLSLRDLTRALMMS